MLSYLWVHNLNAQGLNAEPQGKRSGSCTRFRDTSQDFSGQPQFSEDAMLSVTHLVHNSYSLKHTQEKAVLQEATNMNTASNRIPLWMQFFFSILTR
jgi:hypothetical protein